MFICLHSFSISERGGAWGGGEMPRTCVCVEVRGAGVGVFQLKKDCNRFYFQDFGFSEIRVDSSKITQNPFPIS